MFASLEKLSLNWLKSSKLAPTEYIGTQTGRFLTANFTCFSVHRTRSVVGEHLRKQIAD